MNAPALAARAPDGETYAATGTGDARISCTIRRIDVSRPPGVSSVNTTSCAPSFEARERPRWTYSTVAGPIAPSIDRVNIDGGAATPSVDPKARTAIAAAAM